MRTELGVAGVDNPGVELSRRSASGNEGEGDDASPARRAAARGTAARLVVEQTLVWVTRNGATETVTVHGADFGLASSMRDAGQASRVGRV